MKNKRCWMGVKIKKYIENDDSNEVLVIKEEVGFDTNTSIGYYRKEFDKLVKNGIVKSGEFDDNNWACVTEFYKNVNIEFGFQIYPETNVKLKAYALFKINDRNTTVLNAKRAIQIVSLYLKQTNFLDSNNVISIQDEIKTWKIEAKRSLCHVREFLNYINEDINNPHFEVLEKISIPESKTRVIPNYYSIINFNYLIQHFIESANDEIKYKYYPLIIWWELSKIIPMRPIEIAILKRDCIEYDGVDYYISITRRKQRRQGKVKYKTIQPLTKIKITEELFNLINNYIKYCNKINNSTSLFSYEVFKENLKVPRAYETWSEKLKNDIVDVDKINNLLKNFYKEVIVGVYNYRVIAKNEKDIEEMDKYEIETIQLGDTRHIAFCGLMLQGYNPLTIARIGGHETFSEQLGYQSHLDEYINAYTYMMTKNIRNKILNGYNNLSFKSVKFSKVGLIKKESLGEELYDMLKVKGGRCSSKNFPNDCKSDSHFTCEHFIPDETMTQDIINNELNKVNIQLESKVKYIKSLTKDLIYFGKEKESTDIIDENLKMNTKALNALLKQKALFEAYKLDIAKED